MIGRGVLSVTTATTIAVVMYLGACCPSTATTRNVDGTPVDYFPPMALVEKDPGASEFREQWYSKHLTAMGEPSMYAEEDKTKDVYRFTFLPSFAHPIMVRIERGPAGVGVFAKRLSSKGGYEPGCLVVNDVRPGSEREWEAIDQALKQMTFTELGREEEGEGVRVCLDGEEWIFEARVNGEYRVGSRTSPPFCSSCDDMPFRDAGLLFLRTGGFTEIADVLAMPTSCDEMAPTAAPR